MRSLRTMPAKRPRPKYYSVDELCKEKCWSQLAARMILVIQPGPKSNDEEQCERGLVADLLSQLDDIGVPTSVTVAFVSLSRNRRPLVLHNDTCNAQGGGFKYWPTNCQPATRHSLQRCRSAACDVHLSMIFHYLSSSSGKLTWPSAKRQEIIRLLTAILYLTSDEETLEKMLCLVFDATFMTMHGEEEEDLADGESSAQSSLGSSPNASTLNIQPVARMKREKSIVIQRGEFVASKISDAATWVSHNLQGKVVPTVNNGIDHAGKFVKKTIPPAPEPILDRRTAVITRTYTDAVRRSTHGIRTTAQVVSSGVREGATTVAKIVGDCIVDESMPQNEDEEQKKRRELLAAAGTVGMATFGAVAVLGESILDSSRAVARKSLNVTADIVSHRHGDDAGKIVKDVFESTGNVLEITRTSFQATHISKAATKNIAKMHVGS